jgi:hypothetical protein
MILQSAEGIRNGPQGMVCVVRIILTLQDRDLVCEASDMKESHGVELTEPASVHGPGRAPAGMPLTVRLGEREYAALVRIARARETTAAALVEQLVLHALGKADVPPPADSHPARRHTTYEQATAGFSRDDAVHTPPDM